MENPKLDLKDLDKIIANPELASINSYIREVLMRLDFLNNRLTHPDFYDDRELLIEEIKIQKLKLLTFIQDNSDKFSIDYYNQLLEQSK